MLTRLPLLVGSAFIAGGVMSLAFDPVSLGILAPVSMSTICVAVLRFAVGKFESAVVGYAFGLSFFGAHLLWLGQSIGWVAWALLVPFLSLWIAMWGVLTHSISPTGGIWLSALSASSAWTVIELLRQQIPWGGFPWGQLGFSAVDTPWAGLLAVFGVPGTAFLLVFVGTGLGLTLVDALPSRVAQRSTLRLAFVLAVTLGLALPSSAILLMPKTSGTVTVAIVQGGVPGDGTDVIRFHRQITASHVEQTVALAALVATGEAKRPDLVVWPENSTAVDPRRDPSVSAAISQASSAIRAPILVGGISNGPLSETSLNQGLVWLPTGPTDQAYSKQHPVPFGEMLPLRPLTRKLTPRFQAIGRDVLPGGDQSPLQIPTVSRELSLANAVCFDVAFASSLLPQVAQGAQLIVVQTSNAMFTGTAQPAQQLAISRARAMEAGRGVVIASLNGLSAIVGPDGSVQTQLPVRVPYTATERVPLSDTTTMAVHLSPVWPWLSSLLVVALALYKAVAVRRRVPASPAETNTSGGVT